MFGNLGDPSRARKAQRWLRNPILIVAAALAMLAFNQATAFAVTGSIGTSTIEIDHPAAADGTVTAPGADLYPGSTTCSSGTFPTAPGSTLDWVKDCLTNSDPSGPGTGTLVGGVATGLLAGQTSASPVCNGTTVTTNCAKGHWNGARIVDGIGGNDQDIFLTGGKEDCPVTGACGKGWNVGPGTVGSSKYDASQMYLANNSTTLYFAMERIGNNGTTAFDFEFNKLSPNAAPINCPVTNPPTPCYIPNRSDGDVLLTFEMSGSGNTGSAVAHYFTFTCSGGCPNGSYSEQSLPQGLQVSINDSASTLGEPWGHVDSKGNWVLGSLDRFTFAEAAVPLSALGIIGPQCGGNRFVEIRTRSSSTDTSDLKDTTPIFNYEFASPSASASKTSASGTNSTVTLTATVSQVNSPTYQWQVKNGSSYDNITGATSSTFTYSNFATDDTSPSSTTFTIGSDNYVGKVYTVVLRVHVTDGGNESCSANSNDVTVKKVIGVDP